MTIIYPNQTIEAFYKKFFRLLNAAQPVRKNELTGAEIELLIEFLRLPDEKFRYQRFSTLAKDRVIKQAISRGWDLTKVNINNKLYASIQKGILARDEDGIIHFKKKIRSSLDEAILASKENRPWIMGFKFYFKDDETTVTGPAVRIDSQTDGAQALDGKEGATALRKRSPEMDETSIRVP